MRSVSLMNEQIGMTESGQTLDDLLLRSNLTSSQLRIWLGQMLSTSSPLYNMVLGFRITGALDQRRFQQAFQSLVKDCDALRTVVTHEDGVPMQRVMPTINSDNEFIDLSDQANPEDRFRQWADDRSRRVFDLTQPLFDSVLVRLGGDDHVWYFNQHHLMTDATSTALIYRRMAALYQQLGADSIEPLDPMPSYQEYARFERSLRSSEQAEASRQHWREHPGAFINFFGKRRLFTATESRRHSLDVGKARTERIRQAASLPAARSLTTHLSQFNVLLSIYFAWLYRLTGQSRLSIGTPLHNRAKPEQRKTAGLFVELLPVTVEVQPDDSFETLLQRVSAATTQTLCHGRPGSSSVISQTAFSVVLNYITAAFEPFGDLPMSSEWIHAGHGDPNHHLRLQVHDFDETDSLLLFFDFNEDVFSESQQQWAMEQFVAVLDAMLEQPEGLIHDVDIVGSSERSFLLGLNPPPRRRLSSATVVDLFRDRVRDCPRAPAVTHGQERLSFMDLDAQSNALAQTLLGHGDFSRVKGGDLCPSFNRYGRRNPLVC